MVHRSKPALNVKKGQTKERGPFWKRPIMVPVIVTIVGGIASVIAAFLNADEIWKFILNKPTATPTMISSSAAGPPSEPISTAELSCIQNHNCLPGMDWGSSCIAEYNWSIYSSLDFLETQGDENKCYSQPILDVFYTKDNGLYIFAQPRYLTTSKDDGLFAPLPQSGNVSVIMDLDKVDNGQVWFGIFESPDVHSKGALLVAPPGDVQRQAFALKTMPSEKKIAVSKIFENPSGKYNLGFELEYGSIIANAEGVSMPPIPFTPRTRWLFIGYRAKLDDPKNGTADIQVLFTNLKIKE
jgi:hypothetical protein